MVAPLVIETVTGIAATCIHDVLLKPLERIAFKPKVEWPSSQAGQPERGLWLVGKKSQLKDAANELGEHLGLPALAKQVDLMQAGPKGATEEVCWAGSETLRKVSMLMLPETASRVVTPIRPDLIAMHLHNKVAGQQVVLAVQDEDVLPAGLAVSRCLSPYTAKTKSREASTCEVSFHGTNVEEDTLAQLEVLADSVRISQGLVDMPPNMLTPTSFKDFVVAVGYSLKVNTTVIEGEELNTRGYGGIWNVGKCAQSPPCLIVLSHPGTEENQKGVALVGKGITFDTGGAALKSKEGMCGMKRDMGGAAGCFAAFVAAVRAGNLKKPLHCVLCVAENAIGSQCFLQDDIITLYSGLTVEINNTDAEGRLVLGDGVAHVAKHLDCDLVFDMATLTGAQGVSTGVHHALILATDEELEQNVVAAGKYIGDMAHPGLFAPELLMQEFDSDFADMKNSVANRSNAQSSCAGVFIHKHLTSSGFSGQWVHMDMASPIECPLKGYSTGWGVGILARFLRKYVN